MTSGPPDGARRLEMQLHDLRADVRWPRTPDLAGDVVARLERGEAARARPRRRPGPAAGHGFAVAAVVAAMLLIGGALVPPVRSAVLDALGIAGRDRVIVVPGAPDTSRPSLDRGARTTLPAAQRRLDFTIRLPRALGRPREVRYSDAIAGGAVTLIYPGAALLETQGGSSPLFEKRVGRRAAVRVVSVAGARALFITGAREISLLDRDGRSIAASRSLARSDALVWQRDGIAYRLETRGGLERALAIARSVR